MVSTNKNDWWTKQETDNQKELLAYFGTSPVTQSQSDSTLHWVITGVPSNDCNGVILSRLAELNVEQAIQRLLARFQAKRVPFMWFVDPTDQPADLAQRLLAQGCRRLDPGVGMGILLEDRPEMILPTDVEIRRVSTLRDSAAWIDVWTQMHPGNSLIRETLYNSLLFDSQARLRNYVAWLRGIPVGITQLFLGSSSAGLYCEAVLEPFQNRGIGTALVLTALRDAQQAGHKIVVTGPTDASFSMYQRIGFEVFNSQAEVYHQWPVGL